MPQAALHFEAAVFDMDGVVTRTADLHAAAWQELFDAYLAEREGRGQPGFRPFDIEVDYLGLVDGKPRYEGVQSFLASRDIRLPEGDPADGGDRETVCGLGNRKDAFFERRLHAQGASSYASTVVLIEQLREAGVGIALVTSSRHGREVLERAGVTQLFDAIMDGVDAAKLGLRGKPAPDTFTALAAQLGCPARRSLVFEDAVSGIEAGRAGAFGLVVGIDRGGNRLALARAGADLVVADLAAVSLQALDARFCEETRARAEQSSPLLEDHAWRVEQEGFDPVREREMESLFTVGNGYLGVRGALDTPLPGSQADLFIAGIYDRKHPARPYSEHEFLTEGRDDPHAEIVSLPFPFVVRIRVDGRPLDFVAGAWRELRRTLDLRRGRLLGSASFEDERGRRTRVETVRLASLSSPHLLLQEISVTCERHDAMVEIETGFDDAELALEHPHLCPQALDPPAEIDARLYATRASGMRMALASRTRLLGVQRPGRYYQAEGRAGVALRLQRYVCVYTSRDEPDPAATAIAQVAAKRWEEFDDERAAHEAAWGEFWAAADLRTVGSPATTQALRFNAYHLRIAAGLDPRVSVGARALTGRAYEGHVFWDVEIFLLPFYLHVCPEIARSLLAYRHHTLPGARARARELGYRGACYAWESTVTGADMTPRRILLRSSGREIPIYTGFQQVHVSAGVAYGVWRYFEATRDERFMCEAGAEILFETARFWASRCVAGPTRLHIRGVTGPDEYHHSVDDNAYTNWMAHFNVEKALWAAQWLAECHGADWHRLREALGLAPAEIDGWRRFVRDLHCPQPDASGMIEQFAGFFGLSEYALPEAERFKPPLARLFAAEQVNRSQLIKQADVLMLAFLFPERFPRDVLAANYSYYEPRTDHGSSLSPPVHAALAARLGLHRAAQRYWRRSVWLDLSDSMGNSALGMHVACIAGAWQALLFSFLDLRLEGEAPSLGPAAGAALPPHWSSVELSLAYRGRSHAIRLEGRGGAGP